MRNLLALFVLFILSLSGCKKNSENPKDLLVGRWQGVNTQHTIVSSTGSKLYDSTVPLTSSLEFTADGKLVPGVSYQRTDPGLYLDFGNIHMDVVILELTAKKLVYQHSYLPNILQTPSETAVGYITATYSR